MEVNVCWAELNQFSLGHRGRIDPTDLLKGYFHPLPPSAAFLSLCLCTALFLSARDDLNFELSPDRLQIRYKSVRLKKTLNRQIDEQIDG